MIISFHKFLPFYILFLLIGTYDRALSTFFKKQPTKTTKHIYHKWAYKILFYAYIFIVLFSIGEFFFIIKSINLVFSTLGTMSFVIGAFLRKKSMSDLGENWSFCTEIKENHKLIVTGIYRYLKHPYYLAVILELVGVCLVANAFYSLVLVFLIQGPLLLIRIILEEKTLNDYFGSGYKNYQRGKIV